MYTVYENRVGKYVRVHRSSCGHVKKHGGRSSATPPTGRYHEGFDTLQDAQIKASAIGYPWRPCSVCLPEAHVTELLVEDVQLGRWQRLVSLFRILRPSVGWWPSVARVLDLAKERRRR